MSVAGMIITFHAKRDGCMSLVVFFLLPFRHTQRQTEDKDMSLDPSTSYSN